MPLIIGISSVIMYLTLWFLLGYLASLVIERGIEELSYLTSGLFSLAITILTSIILAIRTLHKEKSKDKNIQSTKESLHFNHFFIAFVSVIPVSYLIAGRFRLYLLYNGTDEFGITRLIGFWFVFIFSILILTGVIVFLFKENKKLFYIVTGIIFFVPILLMLIFPSLIPIDRTDEYINNALQKGDPSFCDRIEYKYNYRYMRDNCYLKMVVQRKIIPDENFCNKIEYDSHREACHERIP
ncbi:MAG: hypothetical protein RL557_93 [archaeon]